MSGLLKLLVAFLAHQQIGALLGFVSALCSCSLQIGYGASTILMSSQVHDPSLLYKADPTGLLRRAYPHATEASGHRQPAAWLKSVEKVAHLFTPDVLVDPALLTAAPPSMEVTLEARGFSTEEATKLSNSTRMELPTEPVFYVSVWFTINAILTNLLSFAGVFFLFGVDMLKVWKGLAQGCNPDVEQSQCVRPILVKLESIKMNVTRLNALYNVFAEAVTHFMMLPSICPAPCEPVIMVNALTSISLIIAGLKVFEGNVHKFALTVSEMRDRGLLAWDMCDEEEQEDQNTAENRKRGVLRLERVEKVMRLQQTCISFAERSEASVEFLQTYFPALSRTNLQGISLSVSFATFPRQPYGIGLSIMGVVLKDVIPELEQQVLAEIPSDLVQAEVITSNEDFLYFLSTRREELQNWMLNVRRISDIVDNVKVMTDRVRLVLVELLNHSSLACVGQVEFKDLIEISGTVIGSFQAKVDDISSGLHALYLNLDELREAFDKVSHEDLLKLSQQIKALLPKHLLNDFIQNVPQFLLGMFLDKMKESKEAGAGVLQFVHKFDKKKHKDGIKKITSICMPQQNVEEDDLEIQQEGEQVELGQGVPLRSVGGGAAPYTLLTSNKRYATPLKPW